ncbi:MAG: hypothetical protein H6577_07775 [Lewinellaceae bacterium]|nr:hypothetical protein [Saprospiraceae bacterium]MCB9338012.1 hypothetical protein [Lewinellaceae bacterium]
MKQHLTQLDLVRFLYKETSRAENAILREALDEDPLLKEEYEEIFEGYRLAPKAKFSPKPSTLQRILCYSEQTALNTMH